MTDRTSNPVRILPLPAEIVAAGPAPSVRAPLPLPRRVGSEIREQLGVLRRHLWIIVAAVLATVGAAAYLVYMEVPRYRATAVIRLADARGALAGGIGDVGASGGAPAVLGRRVDPMLSQIELMRSRTVARQVVEQQPLGLRVHASGFRQEAIAEVALAPGVDQDSVQLGFREREVVARRGGREVRGPYGVPLDAGTIRFVVARRPDVEEGVLRVIPMEAAVSLLLGNVRAVPRDGTDIIDVDFTAESPQTAQQVANSVVETFRSYSTSSTQLQSRRRRQFVEEQLRQTDSLLAFAQSAISAFRSREQLYSAQEKFGAQQEGLMGLAVRRQELEADRGVYQSLLNGLQRQRDGRRGADLRALVSAPGLAQNPVVSQLSMQLVQYETARDSLTAGAWGSSQTNPDVQRLNALVTGAEEKLVSAVRSHLTSLDARIAGLNELEARNTAALRALPGAENQEVRLVQQVETARRMADQLREEYQRARISEAVEVGQVEIVDPATLPGQPIGTGKPQRLLIGLVMGLLLGGGGAFLIERMNTSIRRKEDIETILHLPSLAVIPRIEGLAGSRRASSGTGRELPEVVSFTASRSSSAEAYRTLRTNLLFSQAGRSLRRLVVTSASPAEGKTTTTANLAASFAQQGMRVLLVDCDLRKARLHHVFRVPREPGLTQILLGDISADQAISATPVPGLFVLPSGPLPPNPSELAGGMALERILSSLGERFDLVVVDTPPLTAAADAAILGRGADGVVLVVRAGHTDRGAAQYAVEQLGTVGARTLGAVLNDPDAKVPQYGGYYYASYYGEES